jgi:hypothetical protein
MDQKRKLHADLDRAADQCIDMEEKVYKANKISLDLLSKLQYIECYVPEKDDKVDIYLASFINCSFNRIELKNLFERITPGVYTFGTKKCFIKVEKDLLKVRVGGGFLSIEEFVDQYLPLEIGKVHMSQADL